MQRGTLRQDPLDKIPEEILLCIAVHLPDLPTVLSLDEASPRFAILFNRHGSQILESVMGSSLPIETTGLVRLTAYLRGLKEGDGEPILSLNSFLNRNLFTGPASHAVLPLQAGTSPSLLRGILASAAKVEALTMACLSKSMQRCLAMRPEPLVDKSFRYKAYMWFSREPLEHPAGQVYQPHSSGPPSWLERHRTLRACWYIQMFTELVNAVSRHRIAWIDETFAARWETLEIGELGGGF